MDAKNVVKGVMSWAKFIMKKSSPLGITYGIRRSATAEDREGGPFSRPTMSDNNVTRDSPAEHELYKMHAGLSYCTWNSLGANLSGERVLDSLQDLHESGIKVCNVIVDDNWQTLVGDLSPNSFIYGS
jgi:hypothetical protein